MSLEEYMTYTGPFRSRSDLYGVSQEDTTFQFATSSVREEEYIRPPPDAPRRGTFVQIARELGASAAYPTKDVTEVAPGLLQDGTMTVNHPYVVRYVTSIERAYLEATGQSVAGPSTLKPLHDQAGRTELARVQDVNVVLETGTALNELQSECIVALAALRVYGYPTHAAHFAFWGTDVRKRTAQVVEKIYNLTPRPIHTSIAWYDPMVGVYLSSCYQVAAFPPEKKEKGKTLSPTRMELRKRKTVQGVDAATVASPLDHKGKHVDRGTVEAAPESPRKRARVAAKAATPQMAEQSRPQTRSRKAAAARRNPEAHAKAAEAEVVVSLTKPEGMEAPQAQDDFDIEQADGPAISVSPPSKSSAARASTAPAKPALEPGCLSSNLFPVVPARSRSSTAVSEDAASDVTAVESAEPCPKASKRKAGATGIDAEDAESAPRRKSQRVSMKSKKVEDVAEERKTVGLRSRPTRKQPLAMR